MRVQRLEISCEPVGDSPEIGVCIKEETPARQIRVHSIARYGEPVYSAGSDANWCSRSGLYTGLKLHSQYDFAF